MAAKLFPGEDPVGRQIRNSQTGPPWTIIALIGDVKHGALDEEPQPEMYVSTNQGAMNSPYVVLRTSGDAAEHDRSGSRRSARIDRDLPIYSIQTDGSGQVGLGGAAALHPGAGRRSSACWR